MSDNNDDDDPIGKALNIGPMSNNNYGKAVSNIILSAKDDSAKNDFDFARANLREVVENGNDAIAKLAIIADQSQDTDAFVALSKLMETMIKANKELLELQVKIRDIDKASVPHNEDAKTAVTNNLFVGSTADLAKIIESTKK